jgi:hypothetical protein
MMLATKAYIFSKLQLDSAIIAALGGTANIFDAWPEQVTTFPCIIYQDENQSDGEFADNQPLISRVRYRVDIFTKIDKATTTTIGMAVANLFKGLYFTCGSNGEVQDVVEGVRHRVMRFSREMFASDI